MLCSWDFVLGGSKEGKGRCLILYHISMNFAGCEFCVGGFDHCYTRVLGGTLGARDEDGMEDGDREIWIPSERKVVGRQVAVKQWMDLDSLGKRAYLDFDIDRHMLNLEKGKERQDGNRDE